MRQRAALDGRQDQRPTQLETPGARGPRRLRRAAAICAGCRSTGQGLYDPLAACDHVTHHAGEPIPLKKRMPP